MLDWVTTLLEGLAALCAAAGACLIVAGLVGGPVGAGLGLLAAALVLAAVSAGALAADARRRRADAEGMDAL